MKSQSGDKLHSVLGLFAVLNIGICRARTNNSCAEMACSQRVGTGKIPVQTATTSPWHIDLGAAAEAAKLSLKMFESSRAVFSLSPSRKISEPSRASHKNFHLNFFHGNDDDTGKTFRILQEVAAYLGSTVLTEDEKMSALLYWKCHCEAYLHLSQIAKVYLRLSASSVPVESMFSLAGLVKNSRRSSVAPHRLCFVHDSANFFFH